MGSERIAPHSRSGAVVGTPGPEGLTGTRGYDLGQSVAHLTIQASALGLAVHQMGGFDASKAREVLAIPDGYEPVIAIAVGYAKRPETLPDDLRQREEAPRSRKPLEEFVFTEKWGKPSHHLDAHKAILNHISFTN